MSDPFPQDPLRSAPYIEYPKCLYAKDGQTVTVETGEEESLFSKEGWMTAEQFHAPAPAPKVKPAAPPKVEPDAKT